MKFDSIESIERDRLKTRINVLEQEKAVLEKALEKYESVQQWIDSINNPLEPIKISAALRSEIMKYNFRKANKPESISELDGTIIAALMSALEQAQEAEKNV